MRDIDRLVQEVYPELRRIAASLLRHERSDHTLQRTALVNELFIRLCGRGPDPSLSPKSFLAIAIHEMRQVLVEHARRRRSQKRGGGLSRVPLIDDHFSFVRDEESLLALDTALDRLGTLDPRALSIVELKFFGGFTNAETAVILGVSDGTVEANWQFARIWLFRALSRETESLTGNRQPS